MSVTERLEREVEGCDIRLTFLQHDDMRSTTLRREVEHRRENAVQDLARIESGQLTEEKPPPE
jgi:hypothetical protein